MNDRSDDHDRYDEPVGSVADEAAKLFAVLTGQAQSDTGDEHPGADHDRGEAGDECRHCPVCQAMRMARSVTPEVREHLSDAFVSFARATGVLFENMQTSAADRGDANRRDPDRRDAPEEE